MQSFSKVYSKLVVCIFGSKFSLKMKALQQPKKTQKSNFYEGNETTLKRRKESFVVEEDVTDAIWERLHFSHSNVSRFFSTLTSVLITSPWHGKKGLL